jgi:hypothetical protein
VGVLGGVVFCGFIRMMLGVQVVGMRQVCVMGGRFVISVLGMRGSFVMMMRCLLVMRGGMFVVLMRGFVCHCMFP